MRGSWSLTEAKETKKKLEEVRGKENLSQ